MSEAELSRCPDCGKLPFGCDCPTYDGDDDMTDDPINPGHYQGRNWQCIEIIEAHGLDHFRATALAYILRAARKNGQEDLRKSIWYLRRLAGSPMNLANAIGVATDPERACEMTGVAVADDFGIGAPPSYPSHLRDAVAVLIPNPEEFASSATVLEDAWQTIRCIEMHLDELSKQAAQP